MYSLSEEIRMNAEYNAKRKTALECLSLINDPSFGISEEDQKAIDKVQNIILTKTKEW